MALFQIFNGNESDLSTDFTKIPFHEGYAYFCKDTGAFYIDVKVNNANTRVPIRSREIIGYNDIIIDSEDLLTIDDADNLTDALKTQVYQITLTGGSGSWSNRQQTAYINNLRCGSGNTPPIIICTSGQEEYQKVSEAIATPKVGNTNGYIIFSLIPNVPVPASNIVLSVIDFG